MSYHLFLDDNRNPADVTWVPMPIVRPGWIIVRSYQEFVKAVEDRGLPKFIAFDHDLHYEHMKDYFAVCENEGQILDPLKLNYAKYVHKTGYHCAQFLTEYCLKTKTPLPDYVVHSMNHIGVRNITNWLQNFSRIHSDLLHPPQLP